MLQDDCDRFGGRGAPSEPASLASAQRIQLDLRRLAHGTGLSERRQIEKSTRPSGVQRKLVISIHEIHATGRLQAVLESPECRIWSHSLPILIFRTLLSLLSRPRSAIEPRPRTTKSTNLRTQVELTENLVTLFIQTHARIRLHAVSELSENPGWSHSTQFLFSKCHWA